MLKLAELIATFFYVGRSPKAPGTCGSLAALPFAWVLWTMPPYALAWGIFSLVLVASIWAAGLYQKARGTEDDQTIVIDEVLGILLTTGVASFPQLGEPLFLLLPGMFAFEWLGIDAPNVQVKAFGFFLCFALFRLFDIWKPFPVSWADRNVKGGWGVILDDLLAALLAAALYLGISAFLAYKLALAIRAMG